MTGEPLKYALMIPPKAEDSQHSDWSGEIYMYSVIHLELSEPPYNQPPESTDKIIEGLDQPWQG